MYDYIKGTIANIKNNAIVLDNNGVGFLIYVSNPYSFELGKDYKVYVYQQIKEDENSGVKWININEVEKYTTEEEMKPIYKNLVDKLKNMEQINCGLSYVFILMKEKYKIKNKIVNLNIFDFFKKYQY